MNQQNPYMNLYLNNLSKTKEAVSQEYLFALAINLGHLHNVLGVMIGDVVNLMGKFSFDHQQKQPSQRSNYRNNEISEQNIKIKNKNGQNQKRMRKQTKSNQYIPQKMEIQNLPSSQYNDKMKRDQIIKKQFLLNQFHYNQKKQQKIHFNQQKKKNAFSDTHWQIEGKNEDDTKKVQKQEDQSSQRTVSAEKVRYNQKFENQFQRLQFQKYPSNQKEQKVKYQVKIKDVKKENKDIHRKSKSIFFDLFDSSQTNSNPQQQEDAMQKFKPISQEIPYENKPYYQNEINDKNYSNSNNFLKPKSSSCSTQIKDNKIKQRTNNIVKPYNLLESTFLVSSPKSNLNEVDQIDELETSHKKVPQKIVIKKRDQDKKKLVNSNQNYDEYIPRRQDIGRKKVNRENAKGSQCPDCKAFYDAISDDSRSFRNMCECTSRHKSSTTYMSKHTVQNYSQAFSLD